MLNDIELIQFLYDTDVGEFNKKQVSPVFYALFYYNDVLYATPLLYLQDGFVLFHTYTEHLTKGDIIAIVRPDVVTKLTKNIVGEEEYLEIMNSSLFHYIANVFNRIWFVEDYHIFYEQEWVVNFQSEMYEYIVSLIKLIYDILDLAEYKNEKTVYTELTLNILTAISATLSHRINLGDVSQKSVNDSYDEWVQENEDSSVSNENLEALLEGINI